METSKPDAIERPVPWDSGPRAIDDPKYQRKMRRRINAALRDMGGDDLLRVENFICELLPDVEEEFDADVLEAAKELELLWTLEHFEMGNHSPN